MVQRKLDVWKSKPEPQNLSLGDQLKRQKDQSSINDIESAPSDDTLVEILDAISNNNFDIDFQNSVITNSSTRDQQPDYFLSEIPSH